ncbi:hypothetical protein AVEN_224032-1 [Araneus ventricosus]|uniref:Uncharacterized protein n=1 Tax=Araneus ventricosus TaxID=182803 RepID=A0A4Y2NH77_ARAVE|nr:hypothetical protein AVEN_224032-1 [Araneus ventricosus]
MHSLWSRTRIHEGTNGRSFFTILRRRSQRPEGPVPHQRAHRKSALGFPNTSDHLQAAQKNTKAYHRLRNPYSKRILECQKMFSVPISRTHNLPLHHRKDILWLLHRESQIYRLHHQASKLHQLQKT